MIRPEEWRPQGIDDLELAAWRALHHPGSVCVVAGPGAGKTEFLAQKATYLLQTGLCPTPRQILAISFKRDAADNLLKRVRKRCPPEQARRFTSITFDAFTKSLVDRFFPAIAEEWQPSRPYDIFLPKYRDYDDFLTRSRLAAPGEWQAEVAALPVNTFESRVVGAARLASPPADPRNGETFAIRRWLDERLANGQQSRVTFINCCSGHGPIFSAPCVPPIPSCSSMSFRTRPTRNMIFCSRPFIAHKPRSPRSATTSSASWCGPARDRIYLRGFSRILARCASP